jgi:ABC-type sugar transport system ATPase subunit
MSSAGLSVELHEITKTFGPITALHSVSLQIPAGTLRAIVGENGAGKSTLVRILSGDHHPDSGRILIDGREAAFAHVDDSQAAGIGVVYQELSLFPKLSVAENIFAGFLPTRARGWLDRTTLHRRARELVKGFDVDIDVREPVGRLSVARRQLVEILKVVQRGCRLLIFDEPTSALSAAEIRALFRMIEQLRQTRVTVVYITHKLEEIFELADDVSVMRDGKLVATESAGKLTPQRVISMMVGRELGDMFPSRPEHSPASRPPVLEVRDLRRGVAPAGVSFAVQPGEILGLAGLLGAGRTETLRAIFGIDKPEAGEVRLDGHPLPLGNPAEAVKAGIGFVPEDRRSQGLFMRLSIQENIVAPHLKALFPRQIRRREIERQVATEMIAALSIRATGPEQIVGRLSGGNQQKVLVARWLARRPKLLLVDEPTRGIDVGAKAEMYAILRRAANDGIGIVIVSSEIVELIGLADRILAVKSGRIVGEFAPSASEEEIVGAAIGAEEKLAELEVG